MKTLVKALVLIAVCTLVMAACKTKAGAKAKVASDFSLEIQHSGCRGTCPAYNMRVDATGYATYVGRRSVEMMGDYHKTLDAKTVEAMAKAITDAHFFDFEDEYGGEVADIPGIKTIVTMDGKSKTVNDIRNAPKELKDLEAALEAYFGKDGWVKTQ